MDYVNEDMRATQQYQQLSFDFDFPQPEKVNYWKSVFGFEPKVGELARIDETIAFCETIKQKSYCYCMRVKVIEVNGNSARVITTEEWQKACGATSGTNCAGTVWVVDVNNLAPIFN
jgi:hypothetical protein